MATSGSGTGTPISTSGIPPTNIPDAWPNCAVSLARYAKIIGYDSCAFWGIHYDGQEAFECATFWSEWQRMSVADALAQAQQLIEDVVGFPLCPTWITGTIDDVDTDARYVDQQPAVGNPIVARWGHILAAGVQAESVIDDDATVDYSVEPAVIGPFTTTITDTTEVRVRFPDSDRIITPERMTYTGGVLTIYVPRCRLLSPDLVEDITADIGLEYTNTDNFTTVVDVKRVYNDTSTNTHMVRAHSCDALCTAEGCATQTDTACMVIKDSIMGVVSVHPGTYSSGWTQTTACYTYNHVRLNYLAGLRTLPRSIENVIVRLAHSLMPEEPCGCATTQRLWMRDRKVSEVLTREMLNNPFGILAGSQFAYAWAINHALARGGIV